MMFEKKLCDSTFKITLHLHLITSLKSKIVTTIKL